MIVMKRQVAVVTGGAGFIGSHMVDRLLQEGITVRVIDNLSSGWEKNLEQCKHSPDLSCEWRDILKLKKKDPLFQQADMIFHFAGVGDIVPSVQNPVKYLKTNTMGTAAVCEAARHTGVKKMVYAASSSCYGLAKTPTTEIHPMAPEYPYALSKYLGEQLAFHWHHVYRLPVNTIRIFNAYGIRSRTTGAYGAVFGVFLKQKLSNQPYTVVGDGQQRRDFVYVTDVVDAFWRAAITPITGEAFNVGAGNPQSVEKLVSLLGGPITHIPKRPGEPDCTWANIDKIQSQLGWKPRVSFEAGVKMILDRIDDWKDAPLWDPSSIKKATEAWFQALGEDKQG
jgi:UDP-glucose 4-epimerase